MGSNFGVGGRSPSFRRRELEATQMKKITFKVGDVIQLRLEQVKHLADPVQLQQFVTGKIIAFFGDGEKDFPILVTGDGTRITVNPDCYELVETK